MAADITLLTTRAECDLALASLTRKKGTYARRDYNQTYAEAQATDRATTTAARLAKAQDDVTRYTADVARTGLTPDELRTAKRLLIDATSRRDKLVLTNEATTGAAAYLADIDADQVDAQLAFLEAAITAVTAYRATLSA